MHYINIRLHSDVKYGHLLLKVWCANTGYVFYILPSAQQKIIL